MPPDHTLKRLSRRRARLGLADVRGRRHQVLVLLKQLHLLMQLEPVVRSVVTHYEQLVNGVWASFIAEDRLLRTLAHPSYFDHSSAHRRIAQGLADARLLLHARDPIPRAAFLHCLDALVIHLTIDGSTFGQLEAELGPDYPSRVRQPIDSSGRRDPCRPPQGFPPNALSGSSQTRTRVPWPGADVISN